jgi:hypothetical protein
MGWASGYPAHAPPCWGSAPPAQAAGPQPHRAVVTYSSTPASDSTRSEAECQSRVPSAVEGRARSPPLGWQPSRFLADRGEAERAFRLAERLGSVNAAAAELGTTWPSLRKAFTRHGLGMLARNPVAVRQRAIDAARQRSGQPATPSLDPGFVALNHGELPVRARSGEELAERVRRAEDYAVLGARVVVELHSESHAAKPSTRAWAIARRAQRAHRRQADGRSRAARRASPGRPGRAHQPTPARKSDGCRCPLIPAPTSSAARRGSAPTWPPT